MIITNNQQIHRQYLQSELWRGIRGKALEQYGEICAKCGEHGTDVHHLTYDRVGGMEKMEDLQVLCRECHSAIHSIERGTRTRRVKKKRVNVSALFGYLSDYQRKMIEREIGGICYSLLLSPESYGDRARKMACDFLGIDSVFFSKRKNGGRNGRNRKIHY